MSARTEVLLTCLALPHLDRVAQAEAALLQAQRVDPTDAAIAYALAVLYAQRSQRSRALAAAQTLQTPSPGDPLSGQLLRLQRLPS